MTSADHPKVIQRALSTSQLVESKLNIRSTFHDHELSGERGLYSVSPNWARHNATPIVRHTLEQMEASISKLRKLAPSYHPVVDVRVQRLMPGMYPSIPGWHGDAVPRNDYFSQPDLNAIDPSVRHLVVTLSSHENGVSLTRFVREPFRVEVDQSSPVWQQVHRQVYAAEVESRPVPDGVMVEFGQDSIHCASPARIRGYRVFVRVGMMQRPPVNDDDKGFQDTQQVYLISEENGW